LRLQAGFFTALALGGACRVFIGIYKAGGQSPLAGVGWVGAAHKQNFAVTFARYHNRRGNFGVGKVNPSARRADRAQARIALLQGDRSATAWAKVDGFVGGHFYQWSVVSDW
jgi:hypothetical protein